MNEHHSPQSHRRGEPRIGRGFVAAFAGILFGFVHAGFAADAIGLANVDSHLRQWAAEATRASVPRQNFVQPLAEQGIVQGLQMPGRFDGAGRALVHVVLDGSQPADAVERSLTSLGVAVIARKDDYRNGIMAVWLPRERVADAAHLAGVQSLTLEHAPHCRVGKVTSQGVDVLRTNLVNDLGIKGDGITVGVLSDSFNTAKENEQSPPATTAEDDVKSGDLPVVDVLKDYHSATSPGADEGRAMCQIIYDLAPHCNLAFATAYVSEVDFANNIVRLRAQAHCDVIVDDVGYSDEPVFSDGLLAQAVNTVATSTALPGKKVVYASAAGNDGDNGYRAVYREVSDAQVRNAGGHGNLKLDVKGPGSPHYLDAVLTAGGWHNWNPDPGAPEPVTTIGTADAPVGSQFTYDVFLQWDDLFDRAHAVTAGFNFLVFDQAGNYLPALSGTTDAFGVQQPIQGITLEAGKIYQIAITRTVQSDAKAPAPKVHHLALYTDLDGAADLSGKYFHAVPLDVPLVYGHPAAESAIAVAAYEFDYRGLKPYHPVIEWYTSPGPVYHYFDQDDRRLTAPIMLLKPDVAGVDGVGTTFFYGPGPAFYNPYGFFGTSAAAPHVAGVAALMLQATGGPGSLDGPTVKNILQQTAPPRDMDPLFCTATGASAGGNVSVTALGTPFDTNDFLTISYVGSGKNAIDSITFDGSKAGLTFLTQVSYPPPAVGDCLGVNPGDVQILPNTGTDQTKLTLTFKPGTFVAGASVSFSVTVATTNIAALDYLPSPTADAFGFGATFTASLSGTYPDTITAGFYNEIGTGYNPADGFGLVDAYGAVQTVLGLKKASPLAAAR